MILTIDWSLYAYKTWFQMKSPNYHAQSELELEEFARNMAKLVYGFKKRFKPDDLILALDDKIPWRTGYYKSQYRQFTNFWKNLHEPQYWVVSFDREYHVCKWHTGTETWVYKKMGKPEWTAFEVETQKGVDWLFLKQGKTPESILEQYPEAHKTVFDHPDWAGIKKIVPGYKGNRANAKWNFETPKSEWKDHVEALAYNLASVVGGRAIKAPLAEADDVASRVARKYSGEDIVFCTADQDWYQLTLTGSRTSIWDTFKRDWVINGPESMKFKLFCKILGGDSSDNIKGCCIDGRAPLPNVDWEKDGKTIKGGKTTEKYLRKVLIECGNDYTAVHAAFLATQDNESYTRNFNLVQLGQIPADISKQIDHLLDTVVPEKSEYKLSDFCVDIKQQREIESESFTYREQDRHVRIVNDNDVRFMPPPRRSHNLWIS